MGPIFQELEKLIKSSKKFPNNRLAEFVENNQKVGEEHYKKLIEHAFVSMVCSEAKLIVLCNYDD